MRPYRSEAEDDDFSVSGHTAITTMSQSLIKTTVKQNESMDFEEMESVMWRKHQLRRFFQDRGKWWTASRRSTSWKWTLVVWLGIFVGLMGVLVTLVTNFLFNFKFNTINRLVKFARFYFLYKISIFRC